MLPANGFHFRRWAGLRRSIGLVVLAAWLSGGGCNRKAAPERAADDPKGGPAASTSLAEDTELETTTRDVDKDSLVKLRAILVGFHEYSARTSDQNSLPSRAILHAGKPVLSWRVAILPEMGELALYKQFKLTEPWDSEHNKKLIEKMPKAYQNTRNPAPSGRTYFKVFTGDKTWFPDSSLAGSSKISSEVDRFADTIYPTDGTSNTIMAVEGGDPVIWTKPEDIPYDVGKPLPKLTPPDGSNKLNLVMGDGKLFTVDLNKIKGADKNFRAAITPNANDAFDITKWKRPEEKTSAPTTRR